MFREQDLIVMCEELKELRAEREAIEAREEQLTDLIKSEMLEQGTSDMWVGIHHVKWTKYVSRRFSTKSFRADHEDMYQEYLEAAEASRFTLS